MMGTKMTAWHTGNAGVVIQVLNIEEKGCAAIGFDVFARQPGGLYPDTPEAIRQELLLDIQEKKLGTLVFTHEHADHFCPEDVAEALKMNPDLRIISTEETIRRIRALEPEAGRLTAVAASEQKYRVMTLPGMRLTLFNSIHMGDRFADIQNLVCLLEAGGKHLMLPGDARPEKILYERTAVWSKKIDWLIGPFPLMGLPSSRRLITRYLELGDVLAIHLPRPDKDTESWRKNAQHICETAGDGLPVPVFGDGTGKHYEL